MYSDDSQTSTKAHAKGYYPDNNSANGSKKPKPANWISVKKGMCMYKFDKVKNILEAYEVANLFSRFWSCDTWTIDATYLEGIAKELVKHPTVLNGENLYGSMLKSYSDPILAVKSVLSETILPQYISKLEAYVEESKQFGYTAQEEKLSILVKIANKLNKPDIKADKILDNIAQLCTFVSDNKSFKYWDEFFDSINPICIGLIRNLSTISLNISSCIEGGIVIEQEVFVDENILQE